MIHAGEFAEIRKCNHRYRRFPWRVVIHDKWGYTCFTDYYQSFDGALEFVLHLIHERNAQTEAKDDEHTA